MKRSENVWKGMKRCERFPGASRSASRGASRGVWKLIEKGLRKSEKVRKGMQISEKV